MLSREEQRALLMVAHSAVERVVLDGIRAYRGCPLNTAALALPGAAFVTLRVNKELRGCIGNIRPRQTLPEVIHENAISAATRDQRFEPVAPPDIPALTVEISVLLPAHEDGNPFVQVKAYEDIVIGRDGLYLELTDGRSGILLPQVATENHMNLPQFLDALRHKAGAPANAWTFSGAILSRFQCQVFASTPD